MFVGDSLSLNQWLSLTCMLHTSNPHAQYKLFKTGGLSTFTFPAYKIKVMISRNAFLVDTIATTAGRVLKLDSIESGKMWKEIDDLIQEGDRMFKDMDRLVAYEKGLKTWARWIDNNLDTTKTRVFFQGVPPDHNKGSHRAQLVVERVLRSMKSPVHLLNVTTLSQLRIDGHPSVHWCLAGVPDTWNVLLYAALTQRKTN
ncbi:hypothetical protein PRUPE_3G108100 [Prunus persica]|uniref:Trichome birefringence-like C-terminal domain-containing protein n=1 Tax=Prunus persica TaxID=3760 RepID=A0A251PYD9_PRUPE|nr:hypothetical protein PRUPE_3G108100 [Prunus persica]